jgi:hypothetical protein
MNTADGFIKGSKVLARSLFAAIKGVVRDMDFLALSQKCRHIGHGGCRQDEFGRSHQEIKIVAEIAIDPDG